MFNRKNLLICFVLFLVISLTSCGKNGYVKYSRSFFGVFDTEISFTAYTKDEEEFNKYFKMLENEFSRHHGLYNSFEDYTENNIKTINDNAGKSPVKVDTAIIELLEFSIEKYNSLSDKTNIALGAVSNLWQVERDKSIDLKGKLPDKDKISEGLKHISIENIVIDRENSTVFLKDEKMRLDVGAIAKGYTVEKVMNLLKEKGLENAIISAGGNVKAIGKPQEKGKEKWGVGIQTPNYGNEKIELTDVIFTEEKAVVTSGDYQRFYFVDDKAYNHIIDPVTGYPKDDIKSVTIVTDNSAVADFLSTVLFLENVENGKKILEKVPDSEAFWIMKDGSIHYTKGMERLLKSKGAKNN